MSFCVLVKISKQKINFWYQLEGTDFSPLLMKNEIDIPLCFYVNGNDFNIGSFAKDRVNINDPNAFSNYFDLVKDPSIFFTLHGDSKPIKQLLYYGIENYLSFFIKTILYKSDSIESYRNSFCLRFWFDNDISQPEKILVENLFKEAGYENICEIDSYMHINKILSETFNKNSTRLIFSAVENDLYVKLFRLTIYSLINQIKIEEQGSDPRAKIIAQLILEDIKESYPHIFIDNNKEIPYILFHCISLLKELSPLMRNTITLNSGKEVSYKIKLRDLEDRTLYNRGVEDKVIPLINDLLSLNKLTPNLVDIILIGDDINTSYFKEKLLKKFPNVYGFDSAFENEILKSIFIDLINKNYKLFNDKIDLGTPPKPPVPVRPPIPTVPSNLPKPPKPPVPPKPIMPEPKAPPPRPVLPTTSNASKVPPIPPRPVAPSAKNTSSKPLTSNTPPKKGVPPPPPPPPPPPKKK